MKKIIVLIGLFLILGSSLFAALCGDVNSSGKIDIVDALLIAQFYVGSEPKSFDQSLAEVSGDSKIDIVDALLIAQYYVGLIKKLPGCDVPVVTPVPGSKQIGLYRVFERAVTNDKKYSNKFTDVELRITYTSPSGKNIDFMGFFDGDGKGGGNKSSGNVWKMRFMPDELGNWNYTWSWSDGTTGGKGSFTAVSQGAGKGIIKAYKDNPHWFAYNGTEPVFLKSYYESGHSSIAQPLEWLTKNIYQTLIDNGYNHFQVNWLLPLCCDGTWYTDGPKKSRDSVRLYSEGKASSTMDFAVWEMLERNLGWLNNKDIGLHMFLGFDGGRNDGPDWSKLSEDEKDFFVRYVVARIAPYANIAGWNFVWEVGGSDAKRELGLARLLKKYDVFDHLRTYQDEKPKSNEWDRPEYTYASTENHYIFSSNRNTDKPEWDEPWTHHEACLLSYKEKPVYMSEGNALWRRYWQAKVGATQDQLRGAAWGCVTAASSFVWCGHQGSGRLVAFGSQGLPFSNSKNPYTLSARYIDILTDTMNNEVVFYRMKPQDSLLSDHDSKAVWCLAEKARQYLVFSMKGKTFSLKLESGQYNNNIWIDTKTGDKKTAPSVSGGASRKFSPPNSSTDWVLILRS